MDQLVWLGKGYLSSLAIAIQEAHSERGDGNKRMPVDGTQIAHDLAPPPPDPTGPENIERKNYQQQQRSQQTPEERASKTISRIIVSICSVYTRGDCVLRLWNRSVFQELQPLHPRLFGRFDIVPQWWFIQ